MNSEIRIDGLGDLRRVDRGGYSTIYVSTEDLTGRQVAVKVFNVDPSQPRLEESFLTEARALGRLGCHDVIVTLYRAGFTDGGAPFLVMPYFPRGSWHRVMRTEGLSAPRLVARLMVSILDALGAAHDFGILHCDMKPGNILLADDDSVRVMDFGISKMTSQCGPEETVLGTPYYTAPEVLRGAGPSVASDLYSVGATAVALLTGQPPFSTISLDNLDELAHRAETNNPPLLEHLVPPYFAMWVARLLQPDATKRPGSAAAAKRELVKALSIWTAPTPSPAGQPEPTTTVPAYLQRAQQDAWWKRGGMT